MKSRKRKSKKIVLLQDDTPTNEAVYSAMNNTVIVSEIVRYLDFSQLKRCRRVNKTWDALISTILRKKALIQFDPPLSTPRPLNYNLKTWNQHFKKKVKVIQTLKIENIKLIIYQSRDVQVEQDICRLVDKFGHQIQYLAIRMYLKIKKDFDLFSKILSYPLNSLKEMELELNIEENFQKMFPFAMNTVNILKIRHIGISEGRGGSEQNPPNDLLALSPFPNLKTLQVQDCFNMDKFLQTLKTTPQFGLENLELNGLRFEQPVLNALKEVFDRHAPTLQSLHLDLVLNDYTASIGNLEIIFTQFPKLKKLEMNVEGGMRLSERECQRIRWKFPAGQVIYKSDFPILEDLTIGVKKYVLQRIFVGAFVPLVNGTRNAQNKCVTMKKVHFNIPMEEVHKQIRTRDFWESFENIFPNAILTPEDLVEVKTYSATSFSPSQCGKPIQLLDLKNDLPQMAIKTP